MSQKEKDKKSKKALPDDVRQLAQRASAAEEAPSATSADDAEAFSDEERKEKKAREAIKRLTSDDDEAIELNLRTFFGGDFLFGPWFKKYFWYFVMVVAMLIIYVSNRYYCQQEIILSTRLNDTLQDRRYKALTLSSEIKSLTRRSVVEKNLNDTTLKTSTTPIYTLSVSDKDTTKFNYE